MQSFSFLDLIYENNNKYLPNKGLIEKGKENVFVLSIIKK